MIPYEPQSNKIRVKTSIELTIKKVHTTKLELGLQYTHYWT